MTAGSPAGRPKASPSLTSGRHPGGGGDRRTITRASTGTKAKTLAVWAAQPGRRALITLTKAGTATDNLRGNIRWAKPAPKEGVSPDVVNIAPAPL